MFTQLITKLNCSQNLKSFCTGNLISWCFLFPHLLDFSFQFYYLVMWQCDLPFHILPSLSQYLVGSKLAAKELKVIHIFIMRRFVFRRYGTIH